MERLSGIVHTDVSYSAEMIPQVKSGHNFEEIPRYEFSSFRDWLITFNDPLIKWEQQPTYVVVEMVYLIFALLTFIHSRQAGGRFPYLWWTSLLHGLVVEMASYWLPDVDSFWHSQSTVMLLGRRLPLHIMLLYPVFIYTASVAVSCLRLRWYAEACAVGLVVVLIDLPYDITSVKFLHWTWHDTDPNIYDRHYWVPWNSYYFHASFAASMTAFGILWRKVIAGVDKYKVSSIRKEALVCLLTALCGMPGGVLLFLPIYHPLHDFYHIHTEVCVMLLITIFLVVVWLSDRNPVVGSRPTGNYFQQSKLLIFGLVAHYSVYLVLVLFGSPEDEVSIGMHEPTGSCYEQVHVQNILRAPLKKRRFLCTSDYDEGYYDFHCLQSPPADGLEWYTICGTAFTNRAEYVVIISFISILAATVFYQFFFKSGVPPIPNIMRKIEARKKKW